MINFVANGIPMESDEEITFLDVANEVELPYPPIAAKSNYVMKDLKRHVHDDSVVEILDMTSPAGYLAYQRSISFMAYVAVKEIFGDNARMIVNYSISKNFYCVVENIDLNQESVEKIKAKMLSYVENDEAIEMENIAIDEAKKLMKVQNNIVREKLFNLETNSSVKMHKLRGYYNYFRDVLAPSCANLGLFDILHKEKGFIIIFPTRENPLLLKNYINYEKIGNVFRESGYWTKILGVNNVAELNDVLCKGDISEFVKINEALHEKRIANIADKISVGRKKIVLIAGPSSSGKTTFSKRLGVQLKVNGIKPVIIGLDDYYKDRVDIPVGTDGKKNFESIDSLEVDMINDHFNRLINGEEVEMPSFNFVTGEKEWNGKKIKLDEDNILVVEGIHGLNEKLTENIKPEHKFKIFISALTQINIDDINRISTRDTRFIRRLVRDNNFRGFDAKVTIGMWQDVLKGEIENIFPYQEEADVVFNSALVYELGLLKTYALPLLYGVPETDPEYTEARRLIRFLQEFIPVPIESIPNTSIIREFVGGSVF